MSGLRFHSKSGGHGPSLASLASPVLGNGRRTARPRLRFGHGAALLLGLLIGALIF